MGENEKLSFWYMGKPIEDVGVATTLTCAPKLPDKAIRVVPQEKYTQELGGKPHKVVFDTPNCKLSYKDDMLVVDELTKLPMGIITTNMSQDDLKQSGFPILFVKGDPRKSKSKKHYKPKFTL